MPNVTVELTDGEEFALTLVAADPQELADNFLTNRARVAKEELKAKPQWTEAAVALAKDGGDSSDEWAILLKGKELGVFMTAAQVAAEQDAEIDALALPQARDPLKTPMKRVPFFAMLRLRFGKTAQDLVALAEASIADEAAKALAISKIENEQQFDRNDPLFNLFGPMLDVTP